MTVIEKAIMAWRKKMVIDLRLLIEENFVTKDMTVEQLIKTLETAEIEGTNDEI